MEGCLRSAQQKTDRWKVWGKPEQIAEILPVPGDHKAFPENSQELYLESLEYLGVNLREHDIRFVEDNWESPTLGAWGVGWEVWLDGMEITQFTYFQQIGGISLREIPLEITYGLERIAMYLQGVDNVFEVKWNEHVKYGDVFLENEREFSFFNFEEANVELLFRHFDEFESEFYRLIEKSYIFPLTTTF